MCLVDCVLMAGNVFVQYIFFTALERRKLIREQKAVGEMHAKINCVCEVLQVASSCHTFLKALSHKVTKLEHERRIEYAGPNQLPVLYIERKETLQEFFYQCRVRTAESHWGRMIQFLY